MEEGLCAFMGEHRPLGATAFDGANILKCVDGEGGMGNRILFDRAPPAL